MARKIKSFKAKLASDGTDTGKHFCEVCKTEKKRIKVIGARQNNGKWRPRAHFIEICECNKKDITEGNL